MVGHRGDRTLDYRYPAHAATDAPACPARASVPGDRSDLPRHLSGVGRQHPGPDPRIRRHRSAHAGPQRTAGACFIADGKRRPGASQSTATSSSTSRSPTIRPLSRRCSAGCSSAIWNELRVKSSNKQIWTAYCPCHARNLAASSQQLGKEATHGLYRVGDQSSACCTGDIRWHRSTLGDDWLGRRKLSIKITPGRQRVLFVIGMVFIAAGLALYLWPRSLIRSHCQPLRPIPCRQPHLQRTRQKRPPVPQSQTRHEFNHQFRRFWFCLKMILVVV